MNIVVCVKHVPDATADRRFEADGTVDRVGVDGLLSELDEYAVEQALQVKERLGGGSQVPVVTLRPEKAADAIRQALQMGADPGGHGLDEAIAGQIGRGHVWTSSTPISPMPSFFFNDTATTEIYTLSLHDALPISAV